MGYSDARCYGGDIDTPNLDRMAARGVRFTQGYSTARCGPSRSCLLTGLYAQQTARDVMTSGKIPNYVRFLPEYLVPAGTPSGGISLYASDATNVIIDVNGYFGQ